MLGISQRALLDSVERRVAGRVPVFVRDSGGGAVLTGPGFVGASIALPLGHPGAPPGPVDSYRWLGEIHLATLAVFGVEARLVTPQALRRTRATQQGGRQAADWACFGSLAPWEVIDARGRKLAGFAQRRSRHGALLVAGTLVAEPDWGLLCDALGHRDDAAVLRRRTVAADTLAGRRIDPLRFAAELERRLPATRPDARPA